MFDFTSSKLLILGIIALIVVGPKDLPMLLRTIGKYVGLIRRQAADFRAQFDEAIRDSELQAIKKDVEEIGREAENSIREAETNFRSEVDGVSRDVHAALEDPTTANPALMNPLPEATVSADAILPASATEVPPLAEAVAETTIVPADASATPKTGA